MPTTVDLAVRVRDGIVSTLQALDLTVTVPGISMGDIGGNVIAQTYQEPISIPKYPALVVTSEGLKEEVRPATTEDNDYVLPYWCLLVDRDVDRRNARDQQYRLWRKAV